MKKVKTIMQSTQDLMNEIRGMRRKLACFDSTSIAAHAMSRKICAKLDIVLDRIDNGEPVDSREMYPVGSIVSLTEEFVAENPHRARDGALKKFTVIGHSANGRSVLAERGLRRQYLKVKHLRLVTGVSHEI